MFSYCAFCNLFQSTKYIKKDLRMTMPRGFQSSCAVVALKDIPDVRAGCLGRLELLKKPVRGTCILKTRQEKVFQTEASEVQPTEFSHRLQSFSRLGNWLLTCLGSVPSNDDIYHSKRQGLAFPNKS